MKQNCVMEVSDMEKNKIKTKKELVNLDITEQEIEQILVESNFNGYRLHGAKKWIQKTIDIIKKM